VSVTKLQNWIPSRDKNFEGKERRVGVELEFSGCEPEQILDCITDVFDGDVNKHSIFNYQVKDTSVGDFTLELDAQILQRMVAPNDEKTLQNNDANYAETLLKSAAESLVPWEVVTPPMTVSRLSELNSLVNCLRDKGALGTRSAVRYAFGLHLNPDLPDLSANTLVKYMQAYLCLYDWIYANEEIDVARKITPYINHFDKNYILKVVDTQYQPDLDTFIEDYLEYNPTRNRSLDLLPLIAHIDEKWVADHKEKALIKARPTFHYRLPNCDIDNPEWSLAHPWSLWLRVEQLANNKQLLATFVEEFREDYQRVTRAIDNKWVARCDQLLERLDSESHS
jgi:hypothetical protein